MLMKWVARLKESSQLRRAQEIQAFRSAAANSAWLCDRALANTSRKAIFRHRARALLRLARCSQRMALI